MMRRSRRKRGNHLARAERKRSYGSVDTLDDLSLCMQRFVVPEGAIPAAEWNDGAGFTPSSQQRRDLDKFVRKMASAPSAMACKRLLLPDSLKQVYHPPAVFRDVKLRESVCVLLERTHGGRFVAGWGWLVVRPAPVEDDEGERGGTEELNNADAQEEEDRRQHGHQQREEPGGLTLTSRSAASGADNDKLRLQLVRQTDGQQHEQQQQQQGQISWIPISRRRRWWWCWYWWRGRDLEWIRNMSGGEEAQDQEEDEEAAGESAVEEETMVVRSGWTPHRGRRPLRRLHLGVPHPSFEGPVDLQAVALFRRLPSLARSVVVSGKHRRATDADSTCLPGLGYPASDPSHNDRDAFNIISFSLLELEKEELSQRCGGGAGDGDGGGGCGGGGEESGWQGLAMFLQLHGKAPESCPGSTVFASGGFGSNATVFYGHSDTAVAGLAAALKDATATAAATAAVTVTATVTAGFLDGGHGGESGAESWAVHTPLDDLRCVLTATRNVFGRVVNGVARADACTRSADEGVAAGGGRRDCFGAFVHVEQAEAARAPEAWHVWTTALYALQSKAG
ncbi:hypothetical protein Vretifemale_16223 [Volvox reticuliferus]|uniref:Uncharacterized protein n=1 Tax=Volvox reticuliferus TaxID=1737510 RepID=A0A8J4CR65_9CHLO|nr:hypothetical protein Vretifemale_16223 [Volvox reticuliferus]